MLRYHRALISTLSRPRVAILDSFLDPSSPAQTFLGKYVQYTGHISPHSSPDGTYILLQFLLPSRYRHKRERELVLLLHEIHNV